MARGRSKVVSLDAYRDRRAQQRLKDEHDKIFAAPTAMPTGATVEDVIDLGVELQAAGNRQAALYAYQLALAMKPDNVVARFNLGVLFQDTGDFQGAIEAYDQVLAADPTFADAHFNLAQIYKSMGALWERTAVRHLNEYRKLKKGSNR